MTVGGIKARKAETELMVLGRGTFKNDGFPATTVLLKPLTGRRHQLRVHCSSIGHTIVGDYVYSGKKDLNPRRMFLHAIQLHIKTNNLVNAKMKDPFINDISYYQDNFVDLKTKQYNYII